MAKIISTDHLKTALETVDEKKLDNYNTMMSLSSANNYPYHRIAKRSLTASSGATDSSVTLYITQSYMQGSFGILRVDTREEGKGVYRTVNVQWLVRNGFEDNDVKACTCFKDGVVYYDLFMKAHATYKSANIQVMNGSDRFGYGRPWEIVKSNESGSSTANHKKSSYECWKSAEDAAADLHGQEYDNTVSAVDSATVEEANKVNGHSVETDVPANALFVPSGGKEGQVLSCNSKGAPAWVTLT